MGILPAPVNGSAIASPAGLTRRSYAILTALIILAAALRLAYVWWWSSLPGTAWIDPDNYLGQGRKLIDRHGEWRWTIEAVRYESSYFKAPLYPVMLSLVARFWPGSYEWGATFLELGLSVALVPLAFTLGYLCHSGRCGLLAAALQAIDLQQIQLVTVFRQEEIYIPLATAALAVLAAAVVRDRPPWVFLIAGVLLGAAALGRSLPLLFAGPAALAIWLWSGRSRRGSGKALAYVAGFLLVIVPYSASLSARSGRTIVIENIGSFGWVQGEIGRYSPPSIVETIRIAATRLTVASALELVRGTLRPSGGRALQTMTPVPNAVQAQAITAAVRVADDGLVALVLVSMPLGLALARQRQITGLLVLWMAVNIAGVVVAGYAGPRFRTPFMLPMIVIAATALTGAWRQASHAAVLAGLGATILAAVLVAPSLARSFSGRIDYGIGPWQVDATGRTTTAGSTAGFTVYPVEGRFRMTVGPAGDPDRVDAELWIERVGRRSVALASSPVEITGDVPAGVRWIFVESRSNRPVVVWTP